MLFERHGRTIYNYCFRRVGSWAVAEDLASIVFLEAWRRVDKQLPSGKELPWLFGIATNVVRNRRRSERRYAAALKRVPQPSPEPSFADDSDERIDDEELMGRALALLGRLPRREQEVFALCVGPRSATRTRQSLCGFRSEPCALASHVRVPGCRNSIPVSDMKEQDADRRGRSRTMRGDYPIPPPRDLPPHRVAQRREHLLSEIAQPPWRLRLPRRGLVALVAAALIVVVGTAAAIGGVRAFILDRGFIGLAPAGATPSAPESGELVVD